MSAQNDGGPAFPFDEKNGDGTHYHSHAGMSLRDHFATHAPVSITDAFLSLNLHVNAPTVEAGLARALINESDTQLVMLALSNLRYEYADAMLAQRSKS